MKMVNLVRLNLEPWMMNAHLLDDLVEDDYYQEISCVFNKPGIYCANKSRCWFELPNGRAYTYDIRQFFNKLNILNASEYNKRQINALCSVVKEKVATTKQKDILFFYNCHMYEQRLRRETKKFIKISQK